MLRTRLPLGTSTSLDLHVLGVPPAYILRHDQTLKFNNGVHKLCVLNTPLVQITICISFYKRVRQIFFDKYNRPRFSSIFTF